MRQAGKWARWSSNLKILIGASTLLAGLVVAGAGADASPTASQPSKTPIAPHIMTIMMENTDYSQFTASPAMPYLNNLGHEYADFTNAFGWHYPSLPNYLELLSGSDDNITGDCDITDPSCSNFTNTTLVDQLESAGISWNAYYQGDSSGCDQSDGGGNYPYWHNAFRYFAEFATQCKYLSNFNDLNSNLSSPNAAPFQWVVPDLVNSGGDSGTMSSGDSWLNSELPQIMDSTWYNQGGQIVILYDTGYEDNGGNGGASGGQIPMVIVSAHTRGMGAIAQPVNTAGVLHSIEQSYGLSYLGDAANAINGNLGAALIAGRPTGPSAQQALVGATLETTHDGRESVDTVNDQALGLNGIVETLDVRQGDGNANGNGDAQGQNNGNAQSQSPSDIEVGEGNNGEGVVVTGNNDVETVHGSSNLEGVSCTTARQCYAVGLGPSNNDEAVIVSIVDGQPSTVTPLPSMIGLYGIACPTATTCYAVGYDNANGADAVITITDGVASSPAEVAGGGEWLNAISCPTATQCEAVGLVNYTPSFVAITNGTPGSVVPFAGNAWYANGIDCTSASNCAAVGENSNEQGIVATLVNGSAGTTQIVPNSEYLYGVGCVADGECVLTGVGLAGPDGYSAGAVALDTSGSVHPAQVIPNSNGFGQVICGSTIGDCTSVGAAVRS